MIADQLVNLPNLHKSNVKNLIPKMSPQVDEELHSATDKAEFVPDVVAAHVQECVNAKEVFDGDIRIVILDLGGYIMKFISYSLLLKISYC